MIVAPVDRLGRDNQLLNGARHLANQDRFENHLRRQVCWGRLPLADVQFEIATDWFGYWVAAGDRDRFVVEIDHPERALLDE